MAAQGFSDAELQEAQELVDRKLSGKRIINPEGRVGQAYSLLLNDPENLRKLRGVVGRGVSSSGGVSYDPYIRDAQGNPVGTRMPPTGSTPESISYSFRQAGGGRKPQGEVDESFNVGGNQLALSQQEAIRQDTIERNRLPLGRDRVVNVESFGSGVRQRTYASGQKEIISKRSGEKSKVLIPKQQGTYNPRTKTFTSQQVVYEETPADILFTPVPSTTSMSTLEAVEKPSGFVEGLRFDLSGLQSKYTTQQGRGNLNVGGRVVLFGVGVSSAVLDQILGIKSLVTNPVETIKNIPSSIKQEAVNMGLSVKQGYPELAIGRVVGFYLGSKVTSKITGEATKSFSRNLDTTSKVSFIKPADIYKTSLSRTFADEPVAFIKGENYGRTIKIIEPSKIGLERLQEQQRINKATSNLLKQPTLERVYSELKRRQTPPKDIYQLSIQRLQESQRVNRARQNYLKKIDLNRGLNQILKEPRFEALKRFKQKQVKQPKLYKPIEFKIDYSSDVNQLKRDYNRLKYGQDLIKIDKQGKVKQVPKQPRFKKLKPLIKESKQPAFTYSLPEEISKSSETSQIQRGGSQQVLIMKPEQVQIETPRQVLVQIPRQRERVIPLQKQRQQIQSQRQIYKPITLQRESFATQRQFQIPILLQRSNQSMAQPQLFKQPPAFAQEFKQVLKQPQPQLQRFRQAQKIRSLNILKLKPMQKPKPIFNFKGSSKPSKPLGSFTVLLRRRGKFTPIAITKTSQQAFNIGRERASKTLGTSFKVLSGGKPINYQTPKGFYRSKREKGVLIEQRKYRLSKLPEVKEIQLYKGMKGGQKRK